MRSARRIDGSSSMTRTRVTVPPPRSLPGSQHGTHLAGNRGQRHANGEPAAGSVERDNCPAHRLSETLGDGEPEPDAGRPVVQPQERLEDPFLELALDAVAVIHHLQ